MGAAGDSFSSHLPGLLRREKENSAAQIRELMSQEQTGQGGGADRLNEEENKEVMALRSMTRWRRQAFGNGVKSRNSETRRNAAATRIQARFQRGVERSKVRALLKPA